MPVSRNPLRRALDILRGGRLFRHSIPNLLRDLRYGGPLGGSKPSPFKHLGAHHTESTDWFDLELMFRQPDVGLRPDDLLVDVGCGKGRALAFWLEKTGGRNRIVGIELDPEVAEGTRRRLAPHRAITVLAGDGVALLPEESSLVFLCNPFEPEVLVRFAERAERLPAAREGRLRVVYYNCAYHRTLTARGWELDPLPATMRAAVLRPPKAVG
jgi:SAM-dependent methyltransferase